MGGKRRYQRDWAAGRSLRTGLLVALFLWGGAMAFQVYKMTGDGKRAALIAAVMLGFVGFFLVLWRLKAKN